MKAWVLVLVVLSMAAVWTFVLGPKVAQAAAQAAAQRKEPYTFVLDTKNYGRRKCKSGRYFMFSKKNSNGQCRSKSRDSGNGGKKPCYRCAFSSEVNNNPLGSLMVENNDRLNQLDREERERREFRKQMGLNW
jgi:hypothetical protein